MQLRCSILYQAVSSVPLRSCLCFCVSSCLTFLSDELLPGSASLINPFLPRLLLVRGLITVAVSNLVQHCLRNKIKNVIYQALFCWIQLVLLHCFILRWSRNVDMISLIRILFLPFLRSTKKDKWKRLSTCPYRHSRPAVPMAHSASHCTNWAAGTV